ncbi:MAG: hypothetical protein IPM33_08015 [Phycisphaerales bacterium]|nr:hypothetical protein [Phycisphaerales bacterium]
MTKSGINWKRTIDRFGWYLMGIALGCVLVGLMIKAKQAYLGKPGAQTPAVTTPETPAPTPQPQ